MTSLQKLWDDLLSESQMATIFQTYEWIESWWMAYGSSFELFVIAVFRSDGKIIAVAPLYRATNKAHTRTKVPVRMLRFLGSGTGGTSTSLCFLTRRGFEASGTRILLDQLYSFRSEWDVLDLHLMEAEPPFTRALLDGITQGGWRQSTTEEKHLRVVLPTTYEEYLASLSKKMRTELPYEYRRMVKKYTVDIRRACNSGELQQALDALFQINTKRWQARGQSGSFGNDEKRLFCQEMAQRFLARGWLDFWILELDGKIAALEYGFRYNNIYYPLWVALETEFQAYSAGAVLRAHIIQSLIADDVRIYEFMQGEEPYKQRWGTEQLSYVTLYCAAPYSYGAIYMCVSDWAVAVSSWLKSLRRSFRTVLRALIPEMVIKAVRDAIRRPDSDKSQGVDPG